MAARGAAPPVCRIPVARSAVAVELPPFIFRFLNHEQTFAAGEFSWQPPGQSRLWIYNLHYFDWLRDERRSAADKAALIAHWVY